MSTGGLSRSSNSRNHPRINVVADIEAPSEMAATAIDDTLVPIALLSSDAALHQVLSTAAAGHPLFVARNIAELGELAELHRCSILVTDEPLRHSTLTEIRQCLRACKPAPVFIAVGGRADGDLLVRMLGAGAIDRFMVKPLDERRTRFAIKSAAQQYLSSQTLNAVSAEADEPQPTLIRSFPRHSLPLEGSSPASPESDGTVVIAPTLFAPPVTGANPVSPTVVSTGFSGAARVDATGPARSSRERHSSDRKAAGVKHIVVGSQAASPGRFSSTLERKMTASDTRPPEHSAVGDPTLFGRSKKAAPLPVETEVPANTARRRFDIRQPSWLMVLACALVVAAIMGGIMYVRAPRIDASVMIDSNLKAGREAIEHGLLIEPPERSALYFFSAVLQLDPTNTEARGGIDAIADRLIEQAKQQIDEGQLAQAQSALENVRRLRPDHRQLGYVVTQLQNAQERQRLLIETAPASTVSSAAPEASRPQAAVKRSQVQGTTPQPDSNDRLLLDTAQSIEANRFEDARSTLERARVQGASPAQIDSLTRRLTAAELSNAKSDLLQRVLDRTSENKLVEPANDSAKFYLTRLAQIDPQSSNTRQATETLGRRLGSGAQAAVMEKDFDRAALFISQAHEIGFNGPELTAAENALRAGRTTTPAVAAAAGPAAEPTRIKYVAPEFPLSARRSGLEGWVDVRIVLDARGNVVNPRVEDGRRRDLFARPALEAVKQWKYAPQSDGETSARTLKVRVEFQLNK